MASIYWTGGAAAVAQVATVALISDDSNAPACTFILKVGGVTIVSQVGVTDTGNTGGLMVAAWNASTHPYATGITASGTTTITFTADVAGVPFTIVPSEPGPGTIGAFTVVTASAGPSDWSSVDNWSGLAVPGGSDDVFIENSSDVICYGMTPTAPSSITIDKTFTGKLGLRWDEFTTSADGVTTVSTADEYRDVYLVASGTELDMPEFTGSGSPLGSSRINVNTSSGAATINIDDASQTGESYFHAVNLLANNSSTEINIKRGSVGVANYVPGETASAGVINTSYVSVQGTDAQVGVGGGTTLVTLKVGGGSFFLDAVTAVTTVNIDAGTLKLDGAFKVTTMTIDGGTVYPHNTDGSNVCITTLNGNAGLIDFTRSTKARTVTTWNPKVGFKAKFDPDAITRGTVNETTKPVSITYGEV